MYHVFIQNTFYFLLNTNFRVAAQPQEMQM